VSKPSPTAEGCEKIAGFGAFALAMGQGHCEGLRSHLLQAARDVAQPVYLCQIGCPSSKLCPRQPTHRLIEGPRGRVGSLVFERAVRGRRAVYRPIKRGSLAHARDSGWSCNF
jgi:hypothetical protein